MTEIRGRRTEDGGQKSAASAPSSVVRPLSSGRLAILGWLSFECSTQPFFSLVTTFVYAPYFAAAVAPNPVEGQALWGFATSAAGLVIVVLSPLLGAISDATGPRKPWIV